MIVKNQLAGIDGAQVEPLGDNWLKIRQWCANLGWVHFVTITTAKPIFFVVSSPTQEGLCREFAREAGLPAEFKGRS